MEMDGRKLGWPRSLKVTRYKIWSIIIETVTRTERKRFAPSLYLADRELCRKAGDCSVVAFGMMKWIVQAIDFIHSSGQNWNVSPSSRLVLVSMRRAESLDKTREPDLGVSTQGK